MELKEGNYYEIFCNKIHVGNQREFKIIKYLGNNTIRYLDTNREVKLDTTNTTFADIKVGSSFPKYYPNLFGYRNISILPIHLEKIGFSKIEDSNVYVYGENMMIYNLFAIGTNSKCIGNILLNDEDKNNLNKAFIEKINTEGEELKKKYSFKLDEIKESMIKILEQGNILCYSLIDKVISIDLKYRSLLHDMFISVVEENEFKPVKSINELFERLEDEGISIENKDEVAKL